MRNYEKREYLGSRLMNEICREFAIIERLFVFGIYALDSILYVYTYT